MLCPVPVNNKTLGGLVAKTTGLLGASWLRGTVDRVQVAILPDTDLERN